MKEYLKSFLKGKRVLVLGFGKEGKSTVKMLASILPDCEVTVSDKDETAFSENLDLLKIKALLVHGENYLSGLNNYDVIIKSPGIRLDDGVSYNTGSVTSQTDLFLAVYGKQTIGVTGTKGKSTTSSLIHHILNSSHIHAVFGGNIGTPLFDLTDHITPDTIVVCELSSHQLQFTRNAPHIGILLNIFQEHLDHYNTFLDYQKAKFNIALYQKAKDFFIYNSTDPYINALISETTPPGQMIPFNSVNGGSYSITEEPDGIFFRDEKILPVDFECKLIGTHNRTNAIVAAVAAKLSGVPTDIIRTSISTFVPLEHRLEYVGTFNGVRFINDSISTIPEAAIAASESLKPVTTIILGGFDRGIDYTPLIDYLKTGSIKNVVATGPAGLNIFEHSAAITEIEELYYISKFDEAVIKAIEITEPGGTVLLSPAASSYNEFRNFEERGRRFKEIVSGKN